MSLGLGKGTCDLLNGLCMLHVVAKSVYLGVQ